MCSPGSSPITAPSSTGSAKVTRARSMPRSARARSASWCAPARGSCSCASGAARPVFSDTALRRLHDEVGAGRGAGPADRPAGAAQTIRNGLAFTVDVSPATSATGHRRLQGAPPYRRDRRRPDRSLRPARVLGAGLSASRRRGPDGIVLDPNDFYILASREAVVVPPDHAAEMLPYDTFVGEFRVHYAGFFDPGFGVGRGRRQRQPRRPRSALARGAVSDRARPDRRPARL